jgi:hypothetical protein
MEKRLEDNLSVQIETRKNEKKDNKNNLKKLHIQIMQCCILCYNGPINAFNSRTQVKKGLKLSYYKKLK